MSMLGAETSAAMETARCGAGPEGPPAGSGRWVLEGRGIEGLKGGTSPGPTNFLAASAEGEMQGPTGH